MTRRQALRSEAAAAEESVLASDVEVEGRAIRPECSLEISVHHPNRRKSKPNSKTLGTVATGPTRHGCTQIHTDQRERSRRPCIGERR
jgi:hypothetical protein